jgi:hypothetical protein
MTASGLKDDYKEQPRNVDILELTLLSRPVEFSVVHSWHYLIQNKPEEVRGASALFLEWPLSENTMGLTSALNSNQFHRLAELATSSNNPLPLVFIDAEQSLSDILKIHTEQLVEAGALTGTGYLAYRTFADARRRLTRRAFLQAAGASVLSIHALTSLLSTLADYRQEANSGRAARRLSQLDEYNPLHPKIVVALRNRIFAFKSLLAAKFLIEGIPDDPVWQPLTPDRLPRFPLLVGGTHTDVGRHLQRDPNELWREIVEMSRSCGVSDEFVASAARVPISKYDSARGGWDIITIVDAEAQR